MSNGSDVVIATATLENLNLDDKRQRKLYGPDPVAPPKASKARVISIPGRDDDKGYAEGAAILRTLMEGRSGFLRDRDTLVVSNQLGKQSKGARSDDLRKRLAQNRAASPKKSEPAPAAGSLAPQVEIALALLRNGTRPTHLLRDHAKMLAELDQDLDVVQEAIAVQQSLLERIAAELSLKVAENIKAKHRELVLQQFRSAQQFAAANDKLRELRQAVAESGHQWVPDALPEPVSRAQLMLGSETQWDSEISRIRRFLEDQKII
jgi:hypothetical protein